MRCLEPASTGERGPFTAGTLKPEEGLRLRGSDGEGVRETPVLMRVPQPAYGSPRPLRYYRYTAGTALSSTGSRERDFPTPFSTLVRSCEA
jgi:hypothetical protein